MIKFVNKYERYISIIFLVISITLLLIGIFTRNLENKSIYIIFGEFCKQKLYVYKEIFV